MKYRPSRFAPPCVLLLTIMLAAACGIPSQGRPVERNPLGDDPIERKPLSHYQGMLAELPLRMQSYDLTGPQAREPVVIRDMHVIHDNVRDEILVTQHDRGRHYLWSIDAHNFTLHWKARLERRVDYDPVATARYVFFMDSNGLYEAYDRRSAARPGESRLVAHGRFDGNLFPSAPPASNDSHVFMPEAASNAMRGLSMRQNARGAAGDTWSYPPVGRAPAERFLQISLKAAADSETVAFVNNNQHLYLIDAQSGDPRASIDLNGYSRTPPVIKDGLVFVGSDAGQLFAWQMSGQAAFVITLDGMPHGDIFVKDNWIFVRTLELYDQPVSSSRGQAAGVRAALRPGMIHAYRYEIVEIRDDQPVFRVVDGNPARPWQADPVWSIPDQGQQVLAISNKRLFVLHERNEDFLSDRERESLRARGIVVTRRDELRTVSRRLQVLDINTGKLARPEWDLNLIEFPFVRGSMHEYDRAIYLGTRDGYVFKLYSDNSGVAGGR